MLASVLSLCIGEHTDYGYITLLYQDDSGGLEIKDLHACKGIRGCVVCLYMCIHMCVIDSMEDVWIQAPPIHNTFVINLGDALEHATSGLLRATPHRVQARHGATSDRLSFPFFYDPSFDAEMVALGTDQLSQEDQLIAAANRNEQLELVYSTDNASTKNRTRYKRCVCVLPRIELDIRGVCVCVY